SHLRCQRSYPTRRSSDLDKRNQSGAQNLEYSTQGNKENIFFSQRIDLSCGAEKPQHRSAHSHQKKGEKNTQPQKKIKGHAEKLPASLGLLISHGNRVFHSAAHSDACACGLEKSCQGIGHINSSQSAVSHGVPYKKSVGDRVN